MDRKKLEELRRRLAGLRGTQPKAWVLQSLAKQLGRKEVNRGKEPTYESETFPQLRPLSIPNHKGRDIPTGTTKSVLDQMEEDIDSWDESLPKQEQGNGSANSD
jgi:hypothetical protein